MPYSPQGTIGGAEKTGGREVHSRKGGETPASVKAQAPQTLCWGRHAGLRVAGLAGQCAARGWAAVGRRRGHSARIL